MAQEGLSGIFNSLADGKEPNDEDYDKLFKVIEEALDNIPF